MGGTSRIVDPNCMPRRDRERHEERGRENEKRIAAHLRVNCVRKGDIYILRAVFARSARRCSCASRMKRVYSPPLYAMKRQLSERSADVISLAK